MKSIKWVVVGMVCLLAGVPLCGLASGENLIPNGSFEGGDTSALNQYKNAFFSSLPGDWKGKGAGWAQKGTWYVINAKDGSAAAYMQNVSSISNVFVAPYRGEYRVSYWATARGSSMNNLAITTWVDDRVVIEETKIADPNNWIEMTAIVALDAGSHVFAITGVNKDSNDQDVAIDLVSVTALRPLDDKLTVASSGRQFGPVEPDYGDADFATLGDSFTCTAPQTATIGNLEGTCTGWELYTWSETKGDWELSDSGPGNSFAYARTAGATQKLVWQWDVADLLRPVYSCELTVGGYAGTTQLENFPLLVRISQNRISGFSYSQVASPEDLSFVDARGDLLQYEVENWDPSGESCVWVRVPKLSGKATKFRMRWGHAMSVPNDPTAVWTGYIGVWHFSALVDSTTVRNSARNDYDLKFPEGKTGSIAANAPAGMGLFCENGTMRTKDYEPEFSVGAKFTATGWFYLPSYEGTSGKYAGLVSKKVGLDWNATVGWYLQMNQSKTTVGLVESGSTETKCTSLPDVTKNWNHFALISDGTYAKAYFNGSSSPGIDRTTAIKASSTEFQVGTASGYFDEYRIRKGTVSVDWAGAEYATVAQTDYVTAGATELQASDVIAVTSGGLRYGEVTPAYGLIAEPVDGTQYDFSCTMTTQLLNEAGTSRAVCTGWELRRLSDDELIRTSSSEGERLFACSHQYVQGEGVELTWHWQVQHFVTATASEGGTVSPTSTWAVAGMSLPISAKASNGYSFYRWNGDANSTDAEIEMTVDGPKSVKALFAIETHVSTKEEFSTALTEALSSIKAGEICAETIWLADGNYQLAAKTTIDVPIKIRSESDDPAKVIFTPSGKSGHEMFVLAHADAGLYGLTIKGGTGTGGQSYTTYGCAQGADVTITTAGGKVENCILCGASASNWGACASALKQGAGLVSRCVISNNTSSCDWDNAAYNTYGCAAIVYGGVIENTLITKNSTGGSNAGGGAICMTGTGTMINCTVAGNTMNGYAGVFFNSKTAKAVNCLICNNTSSHRTENYAGVYNGSSYAPYFTACVAPVQINGSCHTAAGLGLKDAGHGDYHPILGSVCLDNGTLDGITPSALDLDGNARIDEDSGKIDIGCYELNLEGIAASVTCTPADTQGLVPVTRTFSSLVQGGTPTAYEWSINGEVLSGETGDTLSRTFTKAGSYTVSLRVSDAKGTYDAVNEVLITALPTNVYVDATSAAPVAPYDTPETAAKTFADAYAAAGDYSVILIAPNTYERTSQITISKKVTVRGTGKSPLDTRFVLKNANNTRVMQMNCKEALVCNLTLEGGWVNTQNGKGAGVYIADKGGTVSNCVIRSCKCGSQDECGGGAFLGCADACITHCVFTNCSVVGESCGQNSGARGGFAASITAGTLRDSLIVGCYQNGFNKNYPGDDGAVAMHGGKLVNCTITGCRAEECAGIRAEGGQVINCIVSGNTTTSTNPTNAVWRGTGTTVRNSLADQDVGGKFASEEAALTFVGTGTHRYRLRAGSKAVDVGDSSAVTSTVDLRGNPRVQCGAVDLGCYEARIGLTVLVR